VRKDNAFFSSHQEKLRFFFAITKNISTFANQREKSQIVK
jgi:hypothetical protein